MSPRSSLKLYRRIPSLPTGLYEPATSSTSLGCAVSCAEGVFALLSEQAEAKGISARAKPAVFVYFLIIITLNNDCEYRLISYVRAMQVYLLNRALPDYHLAECQPSISNLITLLGRQSPTKQYPYKCTNIPPCARVEI